MKNSIVLHIARNKSRLNIVHNGELIGSIEVSERNRTNQASLKLRADADKTKFLIIRDDDDSRFNKEHFNI